MRILANDGIAPDGKSILESKGFEVITEKIAQDELEKGLSNFDVLIVRSATKVNAKVINSASNQLKLIVRAGVGLDNVDQITAGTRGIAVKNTPNSATVSVAELAIAHMMCLARFLHESNRQMVLNGRTQFKELKKKYEKGHELRNKTLGIIGFGRIGQETAKIAIGLGMRVIAFNRTQKTLTLTFDHLPFSPTPQLEINTASLEEVLQQSDFISLNVPYSANQSALIGIEQFNLMKQGSGLINCARGGVVDETALTEAISSGKIAYAALDVFENEPDVNESILKITQLSLTPHIGASTIEAQEKVSKEVAEVVLDFFNKN